MLDFYMISYRRKKDVIEVRPKFIVNPRTKDLMIRGGDFYAVWDEQLGLWSKSEQSVIEQIDRDIDIFIEERKKHYPDEKMVPLYMWDSDSGSIDRFHKYVKQQMRDCFHSMDSKVIFSNQKVKKSDYASHTLSYPLEEGPTDAYEELISTLYSPTEREKIEWAIGAVISGDAKKIQKFEVLYGDKGTGKGTIIDIISALFDGYTCAFDAKALGMSNKDFALESFKSNPLVAIQGDGNLSGIEDNTKLNTIVSHEPIGLNAKYEKVYTTKINAFLFMGTNSPVKITDAKSGILRRLIDVTPTGNKIPYRRYHNLKKQVIFELSGIAYHCLKVYEKLGEDYYENYIPLSMMAATNDFYGFIDYNFDKLEAEDQITLSKAWPLYKEYCEFAHIRQMPYGQFGLELRNYFKTFQERGRIDGKPVRSLYSGFLSEKFHGTVEENTEISHREPGWIVLRDGQSLFDEVFASSSAQYTLYPKKWAEVTTRLSDLDTRREHFVKTPGDILFVDFDKRKPDGTKDLEANIRAANEWPKTYAEASRSGGGLHLVYRYLGDMSAVAAIFEEGVEIKVPIGDSSMRRKLTLCNDIPIAEIKSGLPFKEKKGGRHVVSWEGYKNEQHLRKTVTRLIVENMKKEHHDNTTQSINFIKKILDDAYESGIGYDLTALQPDVLQFAMNSSNQSDKCVATVAQMHFKSDDISPPVKDPPNDEDIKLSFFDIEMYPPDEETGNPGLFLICWKYDGASRESTVVMPNPSPKEVEELFHLYLAGFNCRNYDNPMLWAAANGATNKKLYNLSTRIINNHENVYNESKNVSYIDVFDMSTEKMSLKKWEIRLDLPHLEMDIPWDQPVPEELWPKVIEYCINDVCATEAVFHERYGDYIARKIQVDLVHLLHGEDIKVVVNDTTNTLSKRIIFGNNREPQSEFNYRDLSLPVGSDQYERYLEKFGLDYKFRVFNAEGLPEYRDYIPGEKLPKGWSILPFFKGYEFKDGVSTYLGETIGEGGRVYSVRGYYEWVWDGDIASQHPHSIISEVLFGPRYTKIFEEIVEARVAVKRKDFEKARTMLSGALGAYLTDKTYKDLSQALKIIVNSIYGLTKAGFKNEFRDARNVDNIVAKRGALFMTLLKREVEKRGFMVAHIKTDSIKIPHADDSIKEFVTKFAREYGYEFETEAIFDKFCLFNDAAYLGHDTVSGEWITKADQFNKNKQPFLFKTLFSHEPYDIRDYCETKSVTEGAIYLDLNEDLGEEVDDIYQKEVKKLDRMREKKAKMLKEETPGITSNWVTRKIEEDPDILAQNEVCLRLKEDIPKHHNYRFVGRVGQFTPVLKGCGGGKLYRMKDGKYSAVSGSKGYRWLESTDIKKYKNEKIIDKSYYYALVDEAKEAIGKYVDVEFFTSDASPAEVYGPTLKTTTEKLFDICVPDPVKTDEIDANFMNIPEGIDMELPFN